MAESINYTRIGKSKPEVYHNFDSFENLLPMFEESFALSQQAKVR